MQRLWTEFWTIARRHIALGGAALGFVFLGGLVLLRTYKGPSYLALQPRHDEAMAFIAVNKNDDGKIENVVEPILSIIQNYYVDELRVKSHELLEIALKKLAERADFTLNISDDSYELKAGENELAIERDSKLRHLGFLAKANQIITFLDNLPTASGKESGRFRFLNALLMALDPHSSLLNASDYRDLKQGTEGSFGGLGVIVGIKDNILTVLKPLPRSPAFRAGIRKSDHITRINDINTFGSTLDQLVEHMRGPPGSIVKLSLLREGDISPALLNLTREVIQINSVEGKVIEQDGAAILHLTVESFSSRAAIELRATIEQSQKKRSRPFDGIILDLRSNPGGLLDQAVEMADLFLSSGKIVTTKGRRQDVERASNDHRELNYPLIVLINSDSASASEIVAGALQDQNRAIVLGQPSFGKGSVQTVFELPEDQAVKLTVARYYTPSGRSIQNVGITPHVWLQPLYPNEKNDNLLGSYRYKDENFLLNRLDGYGAGFSDSHGSADFKFYYLQDLRQDETMAKDAELDFAMTILSHLAGSSHSAEEKGSQRASHWLIAAAGAIQARGNKFQTDAEEWLKDKHGIDWRSTAGAAIPALSVDFGQSTNNPLVVNKTTEITVPWRVTNNGTTDLERVSVFVTSPAIGIDTSEFAIGRIPAGKVREGRIHTSFTPDLIGQAAQIKLGVAVDSVLSKVCDENLLVRINKQKIPDISSEVFLTHERGGKIRRTLEAKEHGDLEIHLTNKGDTDAIKVTAALKNLSGNQVTVQEALIDIGTIRAGKVKIIHVPILGSDSLISEQVSIGMKLTYDGSGAPRFYNFEVASRPNITRDRYSKVLGH